MIKNELSILRQIKSETTEHERVCTKICDINAGLLFRMYTTPSQTRPNK